MYDKKKIIFFTVSRLTIFHIDFVEEQIFQVFRKVAL